mgnify:CR=1 FL=1
MPIYEYQCPKCGVFEVIQKAGDKPLKCDPDCKYSDCPRTASRLISQTSFHLKGAGWYKTDYAPGANNEVGQKKAAADVSGSSTSNASETKAPETKSDSSSADSTEKKPETS